MSNQDIRWKQRFQNFEKAFHLLENAIQIPNPDITQKAGLIQFFEICFESSWNLMREYLEEQGIQELRYPRESIKKAYEMGLIQDGHLWLKALEARNSTSHTYDEAAADQVVDSIKSSYHIILVALYNKLKSEL